jgi:hypothetical protein
MSAENGDLNWTEILRQAGGPQNLSPIATAQVFLLSAMLREERNRMGTSNGSNGAINSVPRVAVNHQAEERVDQTREMEMGAMTADTSPGFPGKTPAPLAVTHGQAKKKQTKSHNDQNT